MMRRVLCGQRPGYLTLIASLKMGVCNADVAIVGGLTPIPARAVQDVLLSANTSISALDYDFFIDDLFGDSPCAFKNAIDGLPLRSRSGLAGAADTVVNVRAFTSGNLLERRSRDWLRGFQWFRRGDARRSTTHHSCALRSIVCLRCSSTRIFKFVVLLTNGGSK